MFIIQLFNFLRGNREIKIKLLIIPGYIIGLCCLFLVTCRTLIAFFSESKAVIIHINKFGEQFIDLFALFIIWIICLVGLTALFWMLKKEKISKNNFFKSDKRPIIKQDYSFIDIADIIDGNINKRKFAGVPVESNNNIGQKLNLDN